MFPGYHPQVASGFPFDAHDVMWTRRNTLVYPLTCAK